MPSVAEKEPFHTPLVSRGEAQIMLGGAALMMTLAMGMRQNLGLFQTPASQDLGIAIADFALAISVQQVAWGLSQPFAGILTDRYGTRWVTLAGCALFVAGLILTATATGAWSIVLGAGILIGCALSCTTSAVTASIAARVVVPGRRTLAFGIVSAAGSVGSLLTAPLAAYIIGSDGWRAAMWAFVILGLAMVPAALMGSRADKLPTGLPQDKGLTTSAALGEAFRHPGYIVMACAYFVCGLQLVFLTTHLPTYLVACGMEASYGAVVLALIGGFNILSSWGFGWLGDRYPKRLLLGGLYISRSVALALFFMFPPTPVTVVLFAITMGTLWLGVIPLVNGLVVQIFGLRYLATLTGVAFLSHQTGSFLGAWGGGYIYDVLGSYDLAWQIGVSIGLLAGLMQLMMYDKPTARLAAQPAE
jgi:predicted MFS family arabinose efflux permease